MESSADHHPVTLLAAGFAAFPGAPLNPSEQLVGTLEDAVLRPGSRLTRLVLPVAWGRSWRVLRAEIERVRPDAVLLFGLHAAAERFRIERSAFNHCANDRPDVAGEYAGTAVVETGPDRVEARLPFDALGKCLAAAGLDFEFPSDPGRYLCNETLYQLCLNGPSLGLRYFGFVHTPLTDACADEMRRCGIEPTTRGGRIVAMDALQRLAVCVLDCLADSVARGPERLAATA